MFFWQKMLHRKTNVQPLVPAGDGPGREVSVIFLIDFKIGAISK